MIYSTIYTKEVQFKVFFFRNVTQWCISYKNVALKSDNTELKDFDEVYNGIIKTMGVNNIRDISKKSISKFVYDCSSRWKKACRIKQRFITDYHNWIQFNIQFLGKT